MPHGLAATRLRVFYSRFPPYLTMLAIGYREGKVKKTGQSPHLGLFFCGAHG
jgi:hypothetical protein